MKWVFCIVCAVFIFIQFLLTIFHWLNVCIGYFFRYFFSVEFEVFPYFFFGFGSNFTLFWPLNMVFSMDSFRKHSLVGLQLIAGHLSGQVKNCDPSEFFLFVFTFKKIFSQVLYTGCFSSVSVHFTV